MTIMQTTVASIGRLGLAAAASNRPVLARSNKRPAEFARRSSFYDLLLHAGIAAGWLSERRTLSGKSLARDAKIMVSAKDLLVAGTVLTGAAALVGKAVARQESPADRPVADDEPPSSAVAVDAGGNRGYLRTLTVLNRTFAFLGVAATPFINFALFDSYHPHPVRSFFSLW
jgi:hypothetical protein